MSSVFSWQNSVRHCPASFCTPRPNLLPSISWLPNFASQSPMMKRTSFLVVVLEGLTGLHGTFSFFGISGWGIGLDYCDIECFALETNQNHFVVFETASKYCILDSPVDCDGYSISSKGFFPTRIDILVIWIKISCKDGHNKGQKWLDLTEAEEIKKRWQEYTELYKKDVNYPDNHDGVITHLETDILGCEVEWTLGSICVNKANGVDEFQLSYFKS